VARLPEGIEMFEIGLAVILNVWLASSHLTSSPTNAWAYGKMNTMVEIAHGLAIEAHCPALKVNFEMLSATERFYHIDVMRSGSDFNFMWGNISRNNQSMISKNRDALCSVGLNFYGPTGTRLKGLLIKN
jgi:hypothetical protein